MVVVELSAPIAMFPLRMYAGFNLSIVMVTVRPLTLSLIFLAERFITWYGPSYVGCNAGVTASLLMKTCIVLSRSLLTNIVCCL